MSEPIESARHPADTGHTCDERCVCPDHGTPMYYWPRGNDHACMEMTCRYAGGLASYDAAVLARVGRMYLDALAADPANEMLTLAEALGVTDVRESTERQERIVGGHQS